MPSPAAASASTPPPGHPKTRARPCNCCSRLPALPPPSTPHERRVVLVKHTKTRATRRLALATPTPQPSRPREKPALALWLHPRATDQRLPRTTIRQLIEHYTAPGDLILTSRREHAAEARRLNRRAQPTRVAHTPANVRQLPPRPAQLAILERDDDAAAAASSLAPGGFLVLALPPEHADLGARIRELQADGLEYWQHIVIADPELIDTPTGDAHAGALVVLARSHRDLLVFRQQAVAAAVTHAGEVWAEMVAA
jgi:hypothetical protein